MSWSPLHSLSNKYKDLLSYCTTHCTDQIQVSLKNCCECLYIIDFVTVNNFYLSNYITLEMRPNAVLKTVYLQDSNTAVCKFIVSALGGSQCCFDIFEQQL